MSRNCSKFLDFSEAISWLKNGSYLLEQKPEPFYKNLTFPEIWHKKKGIFFWMAPDQESVSQFLPGHPSVLSTYAVVCLCVSAHAPSQFPKRPFLYHSELYSGTTSSKKVSLILKHSSKAPQCPQNNLCIEVTCYILTYGSFFSFPSCEDLDQVNCRRHSVRGMTENQWKKRWEVRREGWLLLENKIYPDCLVQ